MLPLRLNAHLKRDNKDDQLRVANIGDCGVMIIRNGEIYFRSEEQQHSFNFPYQLGTGSKDSPKDAQSFSLLVHEGDIVIAASDGLWDNIFDEEVLEITRSKFKSQNTADLDIQNLTDSLVKRAREIAEDSKFSSSPFQSRAVQEGLYYSGGKLDDVTVVVGIVGSEEDSPDRR